MSQRRSRRQPPPRRPSAPGRDTATVPAAAHRDTAESRPATAKAPRPRPPRTAPVHNLKPGSPDLSTFPRADWLKAARRALAAQAMDLQQAGVAVGDLKLVEAAATMARLLPPEGEPDKSALRRSILALLDFMPKDAEASRAA